MEPVAERVASVRGQLAAVRDGPAQEGLFYSQLFRDVPERVFRDGYVPLDSVEHPGFYVGKRIIHYFSRNRGSVSSTAAVFGYR